MFGNVVADSTVAPALPDQAGGDVGAVTRQEWDSILSHATVPDAGSFPFGEWDNAIYDNWMADPMNVGTMPDLSFYGADAGLDPGCGFY